jgi:hypothetical protein
VTLAARDRRFAFAQPLLIRSAMTADAQLVKGSFRGDFVEVSVSGIPRVAGAEMTRRALPQERRSAGLASGMVTANALRPFLGLMSKRSIWILKTFMSLMGKGNHASSPVEIEFEWGSLALIGFSPVAITLNGCYAGRTRRVFSRERPSQHDWRHRDNV